MRLVTLSLLALLALLAFAATFAHVEALQNGLGRTPQMGWNSWNKFACDVSDSLLRQTADLLVSTGLSQLGYIYVNVDDCWQVSRDNTTGVIQPDPVRFPHGMAPLVDYVHESALLFGLYSDAGTNTCQGRPGSLGYEKIDAQTYASWGVDYLKYDNCYNENIKPEVRYPPMRDALNATGAPIFFSMCEWGVDQPYTWAPQVGNSWRTTGDINDSWKSMMSNIEQNDVGAYAAGPGGWNDPDMLEIGNGGMTTEEYRVHFSLWSIAKAPLILGMDLSNISNDTMSLISNREVIAINQDQLGVQGTMVAFDGNLNQQTWAGPIVDGWAFVVVNNGTDTIENPVFNFALLQNAPANASFVVRDLWNQVTLPGAYQVELKLPQPLESHSCAMYSVHVSTEKQQSAIMTE